MVLSARSTKNLCNDFFNSTMKTKLFNNTYSLILAIITTVVMISIMDEYYAMDPEQTLTGIFAIVVLLVVVRLVQIAANPAHRSHYEQHGLLLDVAVEFWDNVIARNLYKGYEWVLRAKNRSQYLKGTIVHIPQAGAAPDVKRNRTVYPIKMVKRNDTDIVYVIDELSSDITVVHEAEKWELSYQKVPDVLQGHIDELGKRTAQNALYRWLGKNPTMLNLNAANIVRSSGGNTGLLLPGAAGTRKLITVDDFLEAKGTHVEQTKKESNPGKRAAFFEEATYTEFLTDPIFEDDKAYKKIGAEFKDGDLIKLAGYEIIRTDVVPRFDNAGTPLAKDALDEAFATGAADNAAVGFIDFDCVHIAKSDIKMFFEADKPEYQGDIMNALNRMGASRERVDQAGVVAIIQAPGA